MIGSGAAVLGGSVLLGLWLVLMAASPWTDSLSDVRRLQRGGAVYYRADSRTTRLYDRLNSAYLAIERRQIDRAMLEVRAAQKADPRNPLAFYLEGVVYFETGDTAAALDAVNAADGRGVLRLYASKDVPAATWRWPEFDLIRLTGRRIVDERPDDQRALVSVVRMGQRLAWCEPPDLIRTLQGLEVRQEAAAKLRLLAQKEGDRRLEKLCIGLVEEGRAFRSGTRRELGSSSPFYDDSRATIIARSMRRNDPRFREAAALLYLEKQAKWASELRERMLKPDAIEGLEP